MKVHDHRKLCWCLLVLGLGVGVAGVPARAQAPAAPQPPEPQAPPPLDGPVTGLEALPSTEREVPAAARPVGAVPAEGSQTDRARVHVPQAPPAPILERPSG